MPENIEMDFDDKLLLTRIRIQQWYEHWNGNVYVAFSGGKDSTVLLHIVRSIYPDVKAVFSNTGLEYPEIATFAESFDNVETIRPAKSFVKILQDDGFPVSNKKTARKIEYLNNPHVKNFASRRLALTGYVTSKQLFNKRSKISQKWMPFIGSDVKLTSVCCEYLKKKPMLEFAKQRKKAGLPKLYAYVGMMMGEGNSRDVVMKGRKCNSYESVTPSSVPLKFWNDNDVWKYINDYKIEICSVYKDFNLKRTGCTFCAYGVEREPKNDNRFTKLKESHPKQYNGFINKFGMSKALDYAGISYGQTATHKKAVIKNYVCSLCGSEHPYTDIAFITERGWMDEEVLHPHPTAGMNLFCRECAIHSNLPVAAQ